MGSLPAFYVGLYAAKLLPSSRRSRDYGTPGE